MAEMTDEDIRKALADWREKDHEGYFSLIDLATRIEVEMDRRQNASDALERERKKGR